MEMQMMVKLNFKLTLKSYCFWALNLTGIWDSYICRCRSKLKGKAIFGVAGSFKHLSYLFQLIQISYYFPYAYFYPKCILVLSIMYLLVRICVEYPIDRIEKGFQHYRSNLGKSTNVIFVDRLGTNQIFGEFLGMFELDMGDIVNCCQYVSHYLSYQIMRVINYDEMMASEQQMGVYQYNP